MLIDTDHFLNTYVTCQERLQKLETVLRILDQVNNKGFLASVDLSDNVQFPVVCDLLPSVILGGTNFVNGEKSMESYKWFYNIILISLYFLCILSRETESDTDTETDFYFNLTELERVLLARLDVAIRQHLRKIGVSIIENSYIGFDTEYYNEDFKSNVLVSSQPAQLTVT